MTEQQVHIIWYAGWIVTVIVTLVVLSVKTHRCGFETSAFELLGYVLMVLIGGAAWPGLVACVVLCTLASLGHRLIGVFVPRPVVVFPEDADVLAARREVDEIAPESRARDEGVSDWL